LHDVANEFRELVDRFRELHQRGRAILVNAFEPYGDGVRLDEEDTGGLGKRPSPGSLEFEDGHPFGRGVEWPASRIDLGKASVLDAEFLAEQLVVLLESVVVGCQSDAGIDAVGRPAASVNDGIVGQGDDVQDGGSDVSGPSGGQRDVWQRLVGQR
jgi:hypothetical protein